MHICWESGMGETIHATTHINHYAFAVGEKSKNKNT